MSSGPAPGLSSQFANWALGCTLIYLFLFGIGKIIFHEWLSGFFYIALGFVAGAVIFRNIEREARQLAEFARS